MAGMKPPRSFWIARPLTGVATVENGADRRRGPVDEVDAVKAGHAADGQRGERGAGHDRTVAHRGVDAGRKVEAVGPR